MSDFGRKYRIRRVGIPPVVVSTGEPVARKRDVRGEEVDIPLRCSTLSGAVEVVLRLRDKNTTARLFADIDPPPEWSQIGRAHV